jgi:hypothetical protein
MRNGDRIDGRMSQLKELMWYMCVYAGSLVVALMLLAVFMRLPLFENVFVFYYRTLYKTALVLVVLLTVLIAVRHIGKHLKVKSLQFTMNLILSSVLLVGMAMCTFVTLAPLTIDRSYTIFSLADMLENEHTPFTAQEIEERFSEIYIHQYESTRKRIDEQLSLGNIKKHGDGYVITEKGKHLISLFRIVETIYPVEDNRIIYPEYEENGIVYENN